MCPECFSKNLAWSTRSDPKYWCCNCSARFGEPIAEAIASPPRDKAIEKVDILKNMRGIE